MDLPEQAAKNWISFLYFCLRFIGQWVHATCMCVCWSPLLTARKLNYEGRSSTGSAECIWKAPLAAAKRSLMFPEHSSQARCFLTWVKARPQHRELGALLLTNSVWVLLRRETRPPAYSPYPRRLESLTIYWCNYKGNTFCSVFWGPCSWVFVRPESNSRPPAW